MNHDSKTYVADCSVRAGKRFGSNIGNICLDFAADYLMSTVDSGRPLRSQALCPTWRQSQMPRSEKKDSVGIADQVFI